MIDAALFSLPTWLVAVLIAAVPIAVIVVASFLTAERLDPHDGRNYSDAEQRRGAQARRDVEQRRLDAINGIGDEIAEVYPFERQSSADVIPIASRLMDNGDGLGR